VATEDVRETSGCRRPTAAHTAVAVCIFSLSRTSSLTNSARLWSSSVGGSRFRAATLKTFITKSSKRFRSWVYRRAVAGFTELRFRIRPRLSPGGAVPMVCRTRTFGAASVVVRGRVRGVLATVADEGALESIAEELELGPTGMETGITVTRTASAATRDANTAAVGDGLRILDFGRRRRRTPPVTFSGRGAHLSIARHAQRLECRSRLQSCTVSSSAGLCSVGTQRQ
jgi:hypothetical protein